MKKRASKFPITCNYCNAILTNKRNLYNHKKILKSCPGSYSYCKMSAQKKSRAEPPSYTLIPFNPTQGINSAVSSMLNHMSSHLDNQTQTAYDGDQVLGPWLDKVMPKYLEKQTDKLELMALRSFLGLKRVEFDKAQEEVKDKIDALIQECKLITGRPVYEGLLDGIDYNETPMEYLVISHIRQRSEEELDDQSEKFLEAIFLSIRQAKLFRSHKATMDKWALMEEYLAAHLDGRPSNQPSFLHEAGQMSSQAVDGGDDYSTIGNN